MNIAIFGGAGFVGSSLSKYLKINYPKFNIYAYDNLLRRGSELNLELLEKSGVVFRHCDIRNAEDLELQGEIDLIVDTSADPSVLSGITSSTSRLLQNNLMGSINLLNLATLKGSRFIFLSTSRVYPIESLKKITLGVKKDRFEIIERNGFPGVNKYGISEAFPIYGSARSFYGTSKLAVELLIDEYREYRSLQAIINRFGVIAGPGQFGKAEQGIFSYWLAAHHWSQNLSYIGFGGKGFQVRDFLHINDVCGIVDYQIHHFDELKGQTFNLGGGSENSLSLQELTALCQEVTGKKTAIQSVTENRPADIPWYVTDYSKYRALTGWRPQNDLRTIAEDTYRWMRSNEGALQQIFFA